MSIGEWITVGVVVLGFVGWVFRTLVLDRITALDTRIDRVRDELIAADKAQEERFAASAKDQGTRIGDLRAWTEAHDKMERAVRRARAELSQGIPTPVGQDDSEP